MGRGSKLLMAIAALAGVLAFNSPAMAQTSNTIALLRVPSRNENIQAHSRDGFVHAIIPLGDSQGSPWRNG